MKWSDGSEKTLSEIPEGFSYYLEEYPYENEDGNKIKLALFVLTNGEIYNDVIIYRFPGDEIERSRNISDIRLVVEYVKQEVRGELL